MLSLISISDPQAGPPRETRGAAALFCSALAQNAIDGIVAAADTSAIEAAS